jgi:replicative DNA helicase
MTGIESTRMMVLGSILGANDYGNIDLEVVMSSGISKEWFDDPAQQSLFEVMQLCHAGGRPFDDTTVIAYLKRSDVAHPEDLVLAAMAQKQVPQGILMEHIGTLKEAYRRKKLAQMAREVLKSLDDDNLNADTITQMAQNDIDAHVSLRPGSSSKPLSEVRKMRHDAPPVERIYTGIPFIDTVLTDRDGRKGFRNEGLIFISGLKQSGKTFIATRIIENVSARMPVLFGSLEFGRDLYDENVEQQQKDGIFEGNIDNIITFDDIYDVDSIVAEIRLQHKLRSIKLAVLDSMLRMTNNNPDLKTDERRISEMFSKLGKVSKELKIPVAIIVQSSKEDLKSSMISVKGSMNADHEAYVWFHVVKTNTKDPENELRTVIWNKNKDTHKHPKQHLMFVPQTSDFYRVELDDNGYPSKPLDKYRKPAAAPMEIVYETAPAEEMQDYGHVDMPML